MKECVFWKWQRSQKYGDQLHFTYDKYDIGKWLCAAICDVPTNYTIKNTEYSRTIPLSVSISLIPNGADTLTFVWKCNTSFTLSPGDTEYELYKHTINVNNIKQVTTYDDSIILKLPLKSGIYWCDVTSTKKNIIKSTGRSVIIRINVEVFCIRCKKYFMDQQFLNLDPFGRYSNSSNMCNWYVSVSNYLQKIENTERNALEYCDVRDIVKIFARALTTNKIFTNARIVDILRESGTIINIEQVDPEYIMIAQRVEKNERFALLLAASKKRIKSIYPSVNLDMYTSSKIDEYINSITYEPQKNLQGYAFGRSPMMKTNYYCF